VTCAGAIVADAKDPNDAKRAAVNFAREHLPCSVTILGTDGRIQDRWRYGDLDDTIIS
jgi:hypothetical protein